MFSEKNFSSIMIQSHQYLTVNRVIVYSFIFRWWANLDDILSTTFYGFVMNRVMNFVSSLRLEGLDGK